MFSEFADERHKEQAEAFLLSLGKFLVAFERVCAAMASLIIFILQRQGLKNQGMAQVIVGDKSVRNLREMLGALFAELPDQDEDDRKSVQDLLGSINELTTKRNILVHSNWDLGAKAAEQEFSVGAFRFRKKQSKGAILGESWTSTPNVNKLIKKAKRAQVRLQRLQYCICQSGFKVAVELNKPL